MIGREDIWPWLYRVSNNLCYDFFRQRQKGVDVFSDVYGVTDEDENEREENSLIDPNPLPETVVVQQERNREIQNYLGLLRPDFRRVVILRHLYGFTVTQIAEQLHQEPKKVTADLYRAMQLLRHNFTRN